MHAWVYRGSYRDRYSLQGEVGKLWFQDIVEPGALRRPVHVAWPFLVGGVICLLNCDNERDLNLLNSQASSGWSPAS